MMRVLRNLFVLVGLALALAVQPILAEEPRISGPFTVSLAITPGQGSCAGNFAVEAHGLGQTARGPMFLTIKKCFFPASKTYAGIFALCPSDALCSPDSDNAISGTYAGGADPYSGDNPTIFTPFHGTLTIDRDNGHPQNAFGLITFTAISWKTGATGTAYYALQAARDRD